MLGLFFPNKCSRGDGGKIAKLQTKRHGRARLREHDIYFAKNKISCYNLSLRKANSFHLLLGYICTRIGRSSFKLSPWRFQSPCSYRWLVDAWFYYYLNYWFDLIHRCIQASTCHLSSINRAEYTDCSRAISCAFLTLSRVERVVERPLKDFTVVLQVLMALLNFASLIGIPLETSAKFNFILQRSARDTGPSLSVPFYSRTSFVTSLKL